MESYCKFSKSKLRMSQQRFKIPQTLTVWPWLRTVNPHYHEIKAETAAWLESFKVWSPKARTIFNKCNLTLLAAMAYPFASKDHLRIGSDLMGLFLVSDESTDVGDETRVAMIADVVMDALRNPSKPRPQGEPVVGEIARQFWARVVPSITDTSHRRFIDTFNIYLQSCVAEARDRSTRSIRNTQEYFDVRRGTVGADPCFAIVALRLDIPDFVMDHPSIRTMTLCAVDMIIVSNDLCSYKVEHARGDDSHNILTVVRHEFGQGLGHAVQWAEEYHRTSEATFLSAMEEVPSWGIEIDEQVSEYVCGMANWVRANDCWNFESNRYFGEFGVEIQRHRLVDLACGHPDCTTDSQVKRLSRSA